MGFCLSLLCSCLREYHDCLPRMEALKLHVEGLLEGRLVGPLEGLLEGLLPIGGPCWRASWWALLEGPIGGPYWRALVMGPIGGPDWRTGMAAL